MDLYICLYMVCLFGTVVSGTVTIVLFIRLDIRVALRVLGKKGKMKSVKVIKKNRRKQFVKSHGRKPEEKTMLLHPAGDSFHVVREILLVHTDEII